MTRIPGWATLGGLLAAAGAIACGSSNDPSCDRIGVYRCVGNAIQYCGQGLFGGKYWTDPQDCGDKVCRTSTAGPGLRVSGADGCFAQDAFCPRAGYSVCAVGSGGGNITTLAECGVRASDQTLQWTTTTCTSLHPLHWCGYPSGSQGPDSGDARCMPVVENCPQGTTDCDGNDFRQCVYSTTADSIVFDWIVQPCTASGQVCRVDPAPGCYAP